MGLIRSSFSFMLGTVCGIYIAQNYDIPNMKNLAKSYFVQAKKIEETYRKDDPKSR